MRRKVTAKKLHEFMRELASATTSPGTVYLTGGATALLLGFRAQTIDIDIRLDPEPGGAFEAIAKLKTELEVNIELASPVDFIPAGSQWRERSKHIASYGGVAFYHFDFVLQGLAKLERGHQQDLDDVRLFLKGGFVTAAELRATFQEIQPQLVRYPAVDAKQFAGKVEAFLAEYEQTKGS